MTDVDGDFGCFYKTKVESTLAISNVDEAGTTKDPKLSVTFNETIAAFIPKIVIF